MRNSRIRFYVLFFIAVFLCNGLMFRANAQNKRSKVESQKVKTGNDSSPIPTARMEEKADFQSGNVSVKITENGNTTVRLGLSPHGVTLVEFPAEDPSFAIYPGDENFATVDCWKREGDGQGKRCINFPTDPIVIRPGQGFLVPAGKSQSLPSTTIIVQRVSGMVVTFIIVPVTDPSKNANHVVVTYDVDAVREARMKKGLSVDLVSSEQLAAAGIKLKRNSGLDISSTFPNNNQNSTNADKENSDKNENLANQNNSQLNDSNTKSKSEDEKIGEDALKVLRQAGNLPLQQLSFVKPLHGLSIALVPRITPATDVVIDVIAVRNTLNVPIRLVPEQPEIFIETRVSKGASAVNAPRLPLRYIATTLSDDDVLQPGKVYYFAVVYDAPILGAKQSLRIGFAQMNASDEPITADLIAAAR